MGYGRSGQKKGCGGLNRRLIPFLSCRLTKTTLIFDLPISPWVAGALALLVLAAVIVWTVRDLARVGLFTRIAIIFLTVAGTLLAIGLLLNPRLVREWPDPQKPLLYILADNSRSMRLTDAYKGAEADYIRNAQIQRPGAEGLKSPAWTSSAPC